MDFEDILGHHFQLVLYMHGQRYLAGCAYKGGGGGMLKHPRMLCLPSLFELESASCTVKIIASIGVPILTGLWGDLLIGRCQY